jgi:hypothetical protein
MALPLIIAAHLTYSEGGLQLSSGNARSTGKAHLLTIPLPKGSASEIAFEERRLAAD